MVSYNINPDSGHTSIGLYQECSLYQGGFYIF